MYTHTHTHTTLTLSHTHRSLGRFPYLIYTASCFAIGAPFSVFWFVPASVCVFWCVSVSVSVSVCLCLCLCVFVCVCVFACCDGSIYTAWTHVSMFVVCMAVSLCACDKIIVQSHGKSMFPECFTHLPPTCLPRLPSSSPALVPPCLVRPRPSHGRGNLGAGFSSVAEALAKK